MLRLLVLVALGTDLSHGAVSQTAVEARQCASELETLRFVSTPKGVILPLYWDMVLAAHLTQVYRRTHQRDPAVAKMVVIPLYAGESMMFRRGVHLFVTTGMLAGTNDDAGLASQFRELPPTGNNLRRHRTRVRSSCEQTLAEVPIVYESVWKSLHDSLVTYEEWTRPRLRTRPGGRALVDTPAQP